TPFLPTATTGALPRGLSKAPGRPRLLVLLWPPWVPRAARLAGTLRASGPGRPDVVSVFVSFACVRDRPDTLPTAICRALTTSAAIDGRPSAELESVRDVRGTASAVQPQVIVSRRIRRCPFRRGCGEGTQ